MATADLYPTKTRIALLRDAAAGHCTRNRKWQGRALADVDTNRVDGRKVTAGLAEQEQAGWVTLPDQQPEQRWHRWQITPAGRTVLATAYPHTYQVVITPANGQTINPLTVAVRDAPDLANQIHRYTRTQLGAAHAVNIDETRTAGSLAAGTRVIAELAITAVTA